MPEKGEEHTVCDSTICLTRGHMGLLYDYRRRATERGSQCRRCGPYSVHPLLCRLRGGTIRRHTQDGASGTANLPHDVWILIAARAAAQSVKDLCSLKMSCTTAQNAGDEDFVYRCASIPISDQWWWSGRNFLVRCRQSGHLEILFRAAMSNLFLGGCHFAGMKTMQAVAA
ncbi:hypothetical protein Ahy_A09g043641 isoform A [Arachis hypogaea]|uniref:At2g35280-like TPR domain-containing protein n=1 Tax=Arachis hypogaea TaxID=3818 RepID=A0A445BIS8_ARAHY|nr:hypothetical protein Ahy_A09g043641 isoform A [Arachis hypogaea]